MEANVRFTYEGVFRAPSAVVASVSSHCNLTPCRVEMVETMDVDRLKGKTRAVVTCGSKVCGLFEDTLQAAFKDLPPGAKNPSPLQFSETGPTLHPDGEMHTVFDCSNEK